MATTGAPANLPLMDGSTPITPIQTPVNAIATAMNNYLKTQDSGWVDMTLASGVTGTGLAYRKINGIVYFRGQVSPSTGSFVNGYTSLTTLPAGFRPSVYTRSPIGMFNGYVALCVINSNGAVQIGASADRTADTVYLGGVSFPADN